MDQNLAKQLHERVKGEVKRLLAKNWSIADATRAARVREAFDFYTGVYWKLEKVEESEPYDDSYIDSVAEKKEITRRIENEGVWGIQSSWRLSEDPIDLKTSGGRTISDVTEWQGADATWGFIGDDWKDSGYDTDLMIAAMRGFLHAADDIPRDQLQEVDFWNAVELARFATRNDEEVKKADELGILLLSGHAEPVPPAAPSGKTLPHLYSKYLFKIRQNAYVGWDVIMEEQRPDSPWRTEKMTSAIEPKIEALNTAREYAIDLAKRIPPNPNAIRVNDEQGNCIFAVKSTTQGPAEASCQLGIEFDRPWVQKRYFQNPRPNPMSRNAGAAVAVGVTAVSFGLLVWWLSRSATSSETYRGYTFEVAYISNWYTGTGWKFRFPAGDPSSGNPGWMGVAPSRDAAVASAHYTVDLALGG